MLIDIAANTAIKLAPYLKEEQLEAMSNGDEYVPILPNFELYQTHLSHGQAPAQVATDIIDIKCEPCNAKLLSKFFTRLASETSGDTRDGTFLPKGASTLLGPQTYKRVLKDNNFFLTTVATIPVNLEYVAWFAVIDPNASSDNAPISLNEHLLHKPWFLCIESAGRNKCLIVTTKTNLPEARAWLDENLEPLIRRSIPLGINPPSSLLPCRLDKPVFSATSQSYTDILKKQFSLTTNSSTGTETTDHSRPPCKRQPTKLDYDSDTLNETPSTTNVTSTAIGHHQSLNLQATTMPSTIAAKLLSLKTVLNDLCSVIMSAVKQIKSAVASITTPCTSSPSDMEMDAAKPLETHNSQQQSNDIHAIVNNLKKEIATIVSKTRPTFQQQATIKMTNSPMTSVT